MRALSFKNVVALFVIGASSVFATPIVRDNVALVERGDPVLVTRDSFASVNRRPIVTRDVLTITSRQCDYTDPDGWGNQPQDWANYTATLQVMIPDMKNDLANQEKNNPGTPITYPIGTDTGGGNHWICSILPQGVYLQAGLYVCQTNYEAIWHMDLASLIAIAETIVGNGNNPCANESQGVNGEVQGVYDTHSYYAYIIRWHDD